MRNKKVATCKPLKDRVSGGRVCAPKSSVKARHFQRGNADLLWQAIA